jgi:hypothetical protein
MSGRRRRTGRGSSMNRIGIVARLAIVVMVALGVAGKAFAVATAGAGTRVVVPLVAATASYETEIAVHSPWPDPITVTVEFYEANNSATPGKKTCTALALPGVRTATFSLRTQCPVGAGNHFGFLVLTDPSSTRANHFLAYSRTANPQAIGFSVEGFPIGSFSGAPATVTGLRGATSGAAYMSNCFVATLGEAASYRIRLARGTDNTPLGSAVTGTLGAWQMVRHLDILAAAGVPAGEYGNVDAQFDDPDDSGKALIGFCTVQDNALFSADFRIAKSVNARDVSALRRVCFGNDCAGTLLPGWNVAITDTAKKAVHRVYLRQPDRVACSLVGPRVADLEIQIRSPGNVNEGFVAAGGNNQASFVLDTGERSTIAAGDATSWFIEVGFREGANPTVPIPYGINCSSGNGMSYPNVLPGTFADDF